MEKKKLQKLSLKKECICHLSAKEQINIHGGAEGTTSFNENCTNGPICCDPGKSASIPKSCCVMRCETDLTDSMHQMCITYDLGATCGGELSMGGGGARAGGDCTANCGPQ